LREALSLFEQAGLFRLTIDPYNQRMALEALARVQKGLQEQE
jgi:hypothetical protein